MESNKDIGFKRGIETRWEETDGGKYLHKKFKKVASSFSVTKPPLKHSALSMLSHSPSNTSKALLCPICQISLNSSTQLESHYRTSHDDVVREFQSKRRRETEENVSGSESLQQRIDKVINENRVIVETLDPLWPKRYTRQNSCEKTNGKKSQSVKLEPLNLSQHRKRRLTDESLLGVKSVKELWLNSCKSGGGVNERKGIFHPQNPEGSMIKELLLKSISLSENQTRCEASCSKSIETYSRIQSGGNNNNNSNSIIINNTNTTTTTSNNHININTNTSNTNNNNHKSTKVSFEPFIKERKGFDEICRPSSLSLIPERFSTLTSGSTLLSPETPRSKKSYALTYINGTTTAYTTLGLKSTTRVYYCSIFRPQPMYVLHKPKLSMYSNWQVVSKDSHPSGLSPKSGMSAYDSKSSLNNKNTIYTNSVSKTLRVTHSSEWKKASSSLKDSGLEFSSKSDFSYKKSIQGGYKTLDEDYTYVRGRGRGRYVCDSCGIRCKKPSMLKKHLRTHSNFRPYSCKYCNFAFKTKGNLTKHMKSKAHSKKCVELGICPIPNSLEDSSITEDNSEPKVGSKNTFCPGDSDSETEEENEDEDQDEDENQDGDEEQDEEEEEEEFENEMSSSRDSGLPSLNNSSSSYPYLHSSLSSSSFTNYDDVLSLPSSRQILEFICRNTKKISNFDTEAQRDERGKSSLGQKLVSSSPLLAFENKNKRLFHGHVSETEGRHRLYSSSSGPRNVVMNVNDISFAVSSSSSSSSLSSSSPFSTFLPLPDITIPNSITKKSETEPFKNQEVFQTNEEGKSVCGICHKVFSKSSQLRLHVNIHYFERPFRCESCAVSFRTKGHLQKHKRSVGHFNKVNINATFGAPSTSNPRPFKCSDCKVAFRIHGHLAKHLRSKMHIMKLECSGKLPIGMYAEMERLGTNLNEIDTSDCENSLESLQQIAIKLYKKDPSKLTDPSDSVSLAQLSDLSETEDEFPVKVKVEMNSNLSEEISTLAQQSSSTSISPHFREPIQTTSNSLISSHRRNSFSSSGHDELSTDSETDNSLTLVTKSSDQKDRTGTPLQDDSSCSSFLNDKIKYQCDLCHVTIFGSVAFKQHLMSHATPRPYVCCECDAGFQSIHQLNIHMLLHSKS